MSRKGSEKSNLHAEFPSDLFSPGNLMSEIHDGRQDQREISGDELAVRKNNFVSVVREDRGEVT